MKKPTQNEPIATATTDTPRTPGSTSRRDFLKRGSAAVAIGGVMPLLSGVTAVAQSSEDARTLDRLERANADRERRILLKGGTVISMDSAVGNFAQADVLIQGKKIAAIGPDLSAAAQGGKAVVVDAKDMILIPGFCDPHIHSWQGQIPRIVSNQISAPPDNPTHSYNTVMHQNMALAYRRGGSSNGIPAYQDWLNLGLRPAFSNDDPATYAVDMFTEMHVMYAIHRGTTQRERANGNANPPPEVTTRDMLESATIRGAECCGVGHKVGTLTPGKEADLVLVNTNDIHLYPKHNVITSVVEGAHIGNVDTVFIGGQLRKWRGKLTSPLLGRNLEKIRPMVDESRDYLFAATKWPLGKIDFSD